MGKAGSTWLQKTLASNPMVYVPSVKETNFFDLNFDRGLDWYSEFFASADASQLTGEIAHRYMYDPEVARRLFAHNPEMKIVAVLREPADYIVSDFLFTKRNGRWTKDLDSFVEERFWWPSIAYHDALLPFFEIFGGDQIHVATFDTLRNEPQAFYSDLLRFLELPDRQLTHEDVQPVNVAKKARSGPVAGVVNRIAKAAKKRGFQRLVATVKHSDLVSKALFTELSEKRPELSPDQRDRVRLHGAEQVRKLDALAGTEIATQWEFVLNET